MTYRRLSFIIVALLGVSVCYGQQNADFKKSFDEFRKGLMKEYDAFRNEILADYAKFLDGEWVEYKGFKGQVRNSVPKPDRAPVAPRTSDESTVKETPKAENVKPVTSKPAPAPAPAVKPAPAPIAKSAPKSEETIAQKPKAPTKPESDKTPVKETPKAENVKPVTPKPAPAPAVKPTPALTPVSAPDPVREETIAQQPAPSPSVTSGHKFDYKGISLELPEFEIKLLDKVSAPADYASQWRMFDDNKDASKLINSIKDLSKQMNFNGYLTYELATAYTRSRFADASPSARTSLVHYIMTHLGYDARIGMDAQGQALMLMPMEQMLYSRMFFTFNGEKFYAFTDPDINLSTSDLRVSTCVLPSAASQASKFDMRLGELKIPYSPKSYSIKFGDMEIHGETNANLYPILYKYPQIPIGDYAQSVLMPELRNDIVKQLKKQLSGVETHKAVNKLLQFVQCGFEYETDANMHGFEKPYFFEEILYYPKCDCEDRAIFYTYLLWNVLGVESHLISYPGHESASVSIDGVKGGDAYRYDGKTFYISDPTFIGSKTGMCMPEYSTVSPAVDYVYK